MSRLTRWLAPTTTARAHCDLPCGVYDPEQARIEAESVHRINEKYAANEDVAFRTRAIAIKEERAELVKHHLDVLWHDYFKPEHLEKVPNLHDCSGTRPSRSPRSRRRRTPRTPRSCSTSSTRSTRPGRRPAARRRPGSTVDRPDTRTHAHPEAPPDGGASSYHPADGAAARTVADRRRAGQHGADDLGRRLAAGRPDSTARWPRRGSIVAFREPDSGVLSIKRVAGGPGDRVPFGDGYFELADDEAWLLADASAERDRRGRLRRARSIRGASARCRSSCSSAGSGGATDRGAGSDRVSRPADGRPAPG